MQVWLLHVGVKSVVAKTGVIQARRQAGVDQGGHLGQTYRHDAVVCGAAVARPGLAHQARGLHGAGGRFPEIGARGVGIAFMRRHHVQQVLFLKTALARKTLRLVKHHWHVDLAVHRQRLRHVNVDDQVARSSRRNGIAQAPDPAKFLAAVGRRRVQVRHRGEMRERGLLVTAAVNHGQLAVFVELLETRHAGVPAVVVVDLEQPLCPYAQRRAVAVIGIVAIGHQRVQAVVAARQLDHHQDPIRVAGILREHIGRLPECDRHAAITQAIHGQARQAGPQKRAAAQRRCGKVVGPGDAVKCLQFVVWHGASFQPNWYSGRLMIRCRSSRNGSSRYDCATGIWSVPSSAFKNSTRRARSALWGATLSRRPRK